MDIETFNKNFSEYEASYKPKFELTPLYTKINSKKFWAYTICIYEKNNNNEVDSEKQMVKITVEKEWLNIPIDRVYMIKNAEKIRYKISYFIKKHWLW